MECARCPHVTSVQEQPPPNTWPRVIWAGPTSAPFLNIVNILCFYEILDVLLFKCETPFFLNRLSTGDVGVDSDRLTAVRIWSVKEVEQTQWNPVGLPPGCRHGWRVQWGRRRGEKEGGEEWSEQEMKTMMGKRWWQKGIEGEETATIVQ